MADGTPDTPATPDFTSPKGGLFGNLIKALPTDANTAALIMSSRWTSDAAGTSPATAFKYFFASSSSDYVSNYADLSFASYTPAQKTAVMASFAPLTQGQKDALGIVFGQISSYTGVTFSETKSSTDATYRFVNYKDPIVPGSEARFPTTIESYMSSDARVAGDNFEGENAVVSSGNGLGTDAWATIAHELGHSIGLKHGHDTAGAGALSPDRNDNEFSIMTYASFLGANLDKGATEARDGSAPQSFMMYDIAACRRSTGRTSTISASPSPIAGMGRRGRKRSTAPQRPSRA